MVGIRYLACSVVASCIVVRCILLPGHQLLGVEQLAVGSGPHLSVAVSGQSIGWLE